MKKNKFNIGQEVFAIMSDEAAKDFISVIAKESSHPDANLCYKLLYYEDKGFIMEDEIFATEQELRDGMKIRDRTKK